jgi:phosphopantetheinyl transferase (holo-ACP synthase)
LVCAALEALSPEFWAAHDQIWLKALAHLTLSGSERAQWRALPDPLSRRVDWLLGRVAAKDAAKAFLQRRCGAHGRSADIEILSNRQGVPQLRLLDPRFGAEELLVSLAHSHGAAAAVVAAASEGARIGVDLEVVRKLDPGFASAAFNSVELRSLDEFPAPQRNLAELSAWCAKEAVVKALGLAGTAELTQVTLAGLDLGAHIAVMNLPDSAKAGGATVRVSLLQSGQLVVAVASVPETNHSAAAHRPMARSFASASWSN